MVRVSFHRWKLRVLREKSKGSKLFDRSFDDKLSSVIADWSNLNRRRFVENKSVPSEDKFFIANSIRVR